MQLLVESLALAVIGGAAGLLIGMWGGTLLRTLLMPETHWAGAPFDVRVAIYTAVVTVGVGLLAGLAPALQSTSPDLTSSLKGSARDATLHRSRLRMVLMAAQAALSVLLLAGAGVFIESLRNVKAIDLGYDADRLVFASVDYRNPACRCVDGFFGDRNAIAAGLERAAASLAALPVVERTALGRAGPMIGFGLTRTYRVSGDTIPSLEGKEAAIIDVSPDYFATTGLRLSRGRLLSPNDGAAAPPVMVVNETMARTVWPGENPIGQCLVLGAPAPQGRCYTVVGVVSDGHRFDLVEPPTMQYYVPLVQGISGHPTPARVLIVRAAPGRVAFVAEQARRLLRELFPTAEPPRVTTLTARLAPQLRPWQVGAELFSAFGALALIVAMLGTYSVVAFAVQQRRHELGVRLTVGATGRDVLALLVGGSVRVVAVGVALGVLLTLVLGRAVQAILYDTSATDPLILAAVAVIMVGAAALASFLPGLSATRVDPVTVLRAE
jgi:predicted permease